MRDNDEARMTNIETSSKAQMMNGRSRAFLCSSGLRISFFIFFSLTLSLQAQPPPSAKDILASVRMMEAQQQIDLQGQLRQNDVIVPFRLTQNGPLIRYSFPNPDEVLQ